MSPKKKRKIEAGIQRKQREALRRLANFYATKMREDVEFSRLVRNDMEKRTSYSLTAAKSVPQKLHDVPARGEPMQPWSKQLGTSDQQ